MRPCAPTRSTSARRRAPRRSWRVPTARRSRSSTSTPSRSGRPSSSRRARRSPPSRTSRARRSPRPRAPTRTSSCSSRSRGRASKPTDVTVEVLQHADGWAALQNGSVDAWAGLDPIMAGAEEAGAKLLYRNVGFNSYGFLNATETFLKDKPDLAQAVVDAYEQARAWAKAAPGRDGGDPRRGGRARRRRGRPKVIKERTNLDVDPVPGAAQVDGPRRRSARSSSPPATSRAAGPDRRRARLADQRHVRHERRSESLRVTRSPLASDGDRAAPPSRCRSVASRRDAPHRRPGRPASRRWARSVVAARSLPLVHPRRCGR